MNIFLIAASAVTGYLLGSISFAIIVGKLMYNTDVRKSGSGSAGATNVLRTLGPKAAILVFAGDVLKGIGAYLIGYAIGKSGGIAETCAVIAGISSVLGHNFPIYFRFHGGKGVAASLALCIMLDWRAALIALGIFGIVTAITRIVSLGSMIGITSYAILMILFFAPHDILKIISAVIMVVLIIIQHKQNIKRLSQGKESKIF